MLTKPRSELNERHPEWIIADARSAFTDNAQRVRPDRYRIVFEAGWVKVGKPYMVRSQEEEFVIWVEGGGVEDFRLDQIRSYQVLPLAN